MQSPDAIAELARLWKRYEGDPDGAIRAITETAARALGTARASVWLLSEDQSSLTCVDLYEAAEQRHSSGTVIEARAFPVYFAAMLQEETIAAADAHVDPRTAELTATYLRPLGIGALLDAPIRTGMRLVGVLCHEHLGPARPWSPIECKDAAFLASLASLTLELKSRAMREALLAATLESTGEGILAADEHHVLAYNQRFLDLWGLDARAMRSLERVRRHIAERTGLSGLVGAANEAFAGPSGETVDVFELDDGRVYERSSRPQLLGARVIGRVWSFRDITTQRRAEDALRASEARMRDLAIRDSLTGLFSRRHVIDLLHDAVAHAIERAEPLCVALVDLDHFKLINDQLGHLVGDAVLRDFGRHLAMRFRATDHVGRYGGEEFLIVARGGSREGLLRAFGDVRAQLVSPHPVELPRYTFSAGVAELGVDGTTALELIARADERLYEAKRAGRDATVG